MNVNNSTINISYSEGLFWSIFRNVYLKRRIFTITKLYKLYHCLKFNDLKKLKEFKFREYIIKLVIDFEDTLEIGDIPPSVQHIVLPFYYMTKVEYNKLPSNLVSLKLGTYYNHSLSGGLPSSLQSITFGLYYQKPILPGYLPISLTSLDFQHSYFNEPLGNGVLPPNLRTLLLSSTFNHSFAVNDLPQSLTSLKFGDSFNQILDINVLPSNLKILKLGPSFQQPFIVNSIPPSVKVLIINSLFGQKLKRGAIPNGVEELVIPGVSEPLECGVIPESVTKLEFSSYYNQPIISAGVIPSIKYVAFRDKFNSSIVKDGLAKVEQLVFGESFNQPLKDIISASTSLTSLTIENENYDQDINECDLPSSLSTLTIHFPFDEYKHSIPKSIKIQINNHNHALKDIFSNDE